MPDPVLKLAPRPNGSSTPKLSFLQRNRRRLRTLLLVVIPALALAIGLGLYLAGGRYISTDNAYVGAEKVLITPDIQGK
jgi:membrane fusion protein (multidrug efflux system)